MTCLYFWPDLRPWSFDLMGRSPGCTLGAWPGPPWPLQRAIEYLMGNYCDLLVFLAMELRLDGPWGAPWGRGRDPPATIESNRVPYGKLQWLSCIFGLIWGYYENECNAVSQISTLDSIFTLFTGLLKFFWTFWKLLIFLELPFFGLSVWTPKYENRAL